MEIINKKKTQNKMTTIRPFRFVIIIYINKLNSLVKDTETGFFLNSVICYL